MPKGRIDPLESNSTVYRRRHRLGCTYCAPHGGCNRSRQPTYGKQKPRYKTA